ncbi:hypothetical protein C7Y71_005690 [Pseudoprevotella muciniphila]|uniref:Uncharacterized protein n=1 Tax=Pseudoprevotella muciniphila TaxID=2133944 RepID=A0A5P8E6A8_9BACT|nr:hypothetical protein C7Y71_005690 [Pseudoprevotella muciniphila]
MFALVLCSCGQDEKAKQTFEYDPGYTSEASVDTAANDSIGAVVDSVPQSSDEKLKASSSGTSEKSASSSHRRRASSGRSNTEDNSFKDDGMRGFDPASENDMHDNGMSRFMENNDNEGWD